MTQYYFSQSTKGIYCHEAHGNSMPTDIVPITDEIWQKQEQNSTWVMHYANGKLDVVHPDSLLSQQELLERDKQRQLNHAQHQLMRTGNLVTHGYVRDFSDSEQAEFYTYQDNLRAFIRGDIADIPEPPSYLISYLES